MKNQSKNNTTKTTDEIYKEWSGCDRLENSVKEVHDSTEAIEFAEHFHKEQIINALPSDEEIKKECKFQAEHYPNEYGLLFRTANKSISWVINRIDKTRHVNTNQTEPNLTEEQLQEIKTFLEENLNQEIDVRLINSMKLNEVLAKFFHFNLLPYLAPDTSYTARNFIWSLKEV